MNSENQINVSGALDVKNLSLFHPESTYTYFQIGKWYWVGYERNRYYIENGVRKDCFTDTRNEIQKCLSVKEKHGLFETNLVGNIWIGSDRCIPYLGAMKKEFVFWGDEIPDV